MAWSPPRDFAAVGPGLRLARQTHSKVGGVEFLPSFQAADPPERDYTEIIFHFGLYLLGWRACNR